MSTAKLSKEEICQLIMQYELEEQSNGGFDGSVKSKVGCARDIKYHEATSTNLETVKAKIMSEASPEAIAYLDPLNYSGPAVICDASSLSLEQWQDMRKDSLGSSAAGQVFGECPYPNCTNLDLYYQKTGMMPVIPEDPKAAKKRELLFLHGHLMEEYLHAVTRSMYPNSKLIIDTNIYADPVRPFLTANLDAMMLRSDNTWIHIEYKNTNEFGDDAYANNSIPAHYKRQLIQCQHIMGVWISYLIVACSRDKIIIRKYLRDLDAELDTIVGLEEFWVRNVLARIQPPLAGPSENLIQTIRRYSGYADKQIPEVLLPVQIMDNVVEYHKYARELEAAKQQVERITKLRDDASVDIIAAMQQATRGYVNDGKRAFQIKYTPKAGRRSIDWEQFQHEQPALYDKYVVKKEEGSRTMSVNEVNVK